MVLFLAGGSSDSSSENIGLGACSVGFFAPNMGPSTLLTASRTDIRGFLIAGNILPMTRPFDDASMVFARDNIASTRVRAKLWHSFSTNLLMRTLKYLIFCSVIIGPSICFIRSISLIKKFFLSVLLAAVVKSRVYEPDPRPLIILAITCLSWRICSARVLHVDALRDLTMRPTLSATFSSGIAFRPGVLGGLLPEPGGVFIF